MPQSSAEGKPWTKDRVDALAHEVGPLTVLDVGPGVGTYAKLLAGPSVAHITGLEIWEPYVTTYRLRDYYDEIIVGDARTTDFPEVDVITMGDVAEHMTEPEAVELWRRACEAARHAVYLSIPIVHYPQGHLEGNPHEHHVEADWNHERVLAAFDGIGAFWTGDVVGVYERRTDQ